MDLFTLALTGCPIFLALWRGWTMRISTRSTWTQSSNKWLPSFSLKQGWENFLVGGLHHWVINNQKVTFFFLNQKNLVSIQVQMFIFLEALGGHCLLTPDLKGLRWIAVMKKNVSIPTHVDRKQISSQQTQLLKWIVLLGSPN